MQTEEGRVLTVEQEVMIEKVREFIIDNFLFGEDNGLAADASFLEEGLIDSMGITELVYFLEREFNIKIDDDELVPENLDSLNNISNFLIRKSAVN